MAQVWKRATYTRAPKNGASAFRVGAISIPISGETVCGDAWSITEMPGHAVRLTVADGLGHGLLASDASRAAIRVAASSDKLSPTFKSRPERLYILNPAALICTR